VFANLWVSANRNNLVARDVLQGRAGAGKLDRTISGVSA
jgi:hypothetical protein